MSVLKSYVDELAPPLRAVVRMIDAIVRKTVPDAEVKLKWGHPAYHDGKIFCAIAAHSGHVNLQIWGGAELADPQRLLVGTGRQMRHIRFEPGEPVRRAAITAIVRAAARVARTK